MRPYRLESRLWVLLAFSRRHTRRGLKILMGANMAQGLLSDRTQSRIRSSTSQTFPPSYCRALITMHCLVTLCSRLVLSVKWNAANDTFHFWRLVTLCLAEISDFGFCIVRPFLVLMYFPQQVHGSRGLRVQPKDLWSRYLQLGWHAFLPDSVGQAARDPIDNPVLQLPKMGQCSGRGFVPRMLQPLISDAPSRQARGDCLRPGS